MEEECPLPPEGEAQLSPELRDFVAQVGMERWGWAPAGPCGARSRRVC